MSSIRTPILTNASMMKDPASLTPTDSNRKVVQKRTTRAASPKKIESGSLFAFFGMTRQQSIAPKKRKRETITKTPNARSFTNIKNAKQISTSLKTPKPVQASRKPVQASRKPVQISRKSALVSQQERCYACKSCHRKLRGPPGFLPKQFCRCGADSTTWRRAVWTSTDEPALVAKQELPYVNTAADYHKHVLASLTSALDHTWLGTTTRMVQQQQTPQQVRQTMAVLRATIGGKVQTQTARKLVSDCNGSLAVGRKETILASEWVACASPNTRNAFGQASMMQLSMQHINWTLFDGAVFSSAIYLSMQGLSARRLTHKELSAMVLLTSDKAELTWSRGRHFHSAWLRGSQSQCCESQSVITLANVVHAVLRYHKAALAGMRVQMECFLPVYMLDSMNINFAHNSIELSFGS